MNSSNSLKKIGFIILCLISFSAQQAWSQTCPVSNEITITVVPQPTITISGAATVCTGGTATLTAVSSGGTGVCTVQWQSSPDGITFTAIAAATGNTYTPAFVTTTTYYNAIDTCAGNGCNKAISNTQTITVVPQITITAQPQATNECTGGTNTVSVSATNGTGAISYQWQTSPDNSTWATATGIGATTSTYTPSSTTAGTTYYRVIISATGNGCSPVTSNSAKVIVSPQITISSQPQATNECTGGTNTVSVTVTGGSGTISYQWQTSPDNSTWTTATGTGATTATYTPASTTAGTTYYRVIISPQDNGCNPVTSSSAKVIVSPQITISSQPQAVNECTGGTNTVSVTVTGGSGTISYQWQTSPDNSTWTTATGTGATTATYTPSSTTAGTTYYRVIISPQDNGCSPVTSNSAKVIVTPQISFINSLSDFDECLGGTQSLSILVTGGTGTTTYQWQSSPNNSTWSNITVNGTSSSYTPLSATTGITYYRVQVSSGASGCGTQTSSGAKVTITPQLSITTQPTPFSECISGTQTLNIVSAGGAGTITYQWQSSLDGSTGWTNLTGETNTSYTPPSTTAGDYYYRVIVTASGNGCASINSSTTKVTIVAKPVITATASTTQVCVGGGSVLNATFTGGVGCTLQWQNSTNGGTTYNDIPAATGSSYSTPALSSDTKYRARITCSGNGCCN